MGDPAMRWRATAFPDIPVALRAPSASKREDASSDRSPRFVRRRPRSPGRFRQTGRSQPFSWRCLRSARLTTQPFLRRREASESGDSRGEIDRLPFRIEARRLQPVDPGKQVIDEAGDALIAVRFHRPIEGDQNSRYRDRRHALTLLDQIGIFARLQLCGKIVILELAFVIYWKEFESRLPASAHESVDRL